MPHLAIIWKKERTAKTVTDSPADFVVWRARELSGRIARLISALFVASLLHTDFGICLLRLFVVGEPSIFRRECLLNGENENRDTVRFREERAICAP